MEPQEIQPYKLQADPKELTREDVIGLINERLANFDMPSKLTGAYFQSANFVSGISGWQLRGDGAEINGGLNVTSINIPDQVTANSFHVDSQGNTWWGATTLGAAPAKVTKSGAATFTSITISGYVLSSKGQFGGDGSDGALSLSGSTVNTINLGGASTYVLNYSSISIIGSAKLTFSNPHASGTIITIKCQGNFVASSSAIAIDASGIGATANTSGNTSIIFQTTAGKNGDSAINSASGAPGALAAAIGSIIMPLKAFSVACGSGGGNGGNGIAAFAKFGGPGGGGASANNNGTAASGGSVGNTNGSNGGQTGGRGGGVLYLEIAGSYTNSSTLSVAGIQGGSVAFDDKGGPGGGGAGGTIITLYNSIVSDTATYTVTGGSPGSNGSTPGAGTAGTGGDGFKYVGLNTLYA